MAKREVKTESVVPVQTGQAIPTKTMEDGTVKYDIHTGFEAHEGSEPFLFASYSHRDTDHVYRILNRLNKEKFRIWYDDTMEIGEDFREELRHKIEQCAAFVLFASKSSMASKYCGMEIITAYKNNKKIFPVYIEEDVEIPAAFKMMLENLQHVKGVSTDNEDKYIRKLIGNLPVEAQRTLVIRDGVIKKCKDGSRLINLPDEVHTIDKEAFKACEKLEEVNISTTLEVICNEAFRGCKAIKKLFVPHNVRSIGDSCFRDCISLEEVIIENDQIEIGERAFENCPALTSLVLPSGLMEIYGGIFNSCRALENIKLPESLTILGESAFSNCSNLKSVDIPADVTKIDDMAFNGCVEMNKVKLNEGLSKIGKSAFKDCKALTTVHIPSSVHMIGVSPFRGCETLESITVESKNRFFKSVDDILFNKNKSILICYPSMKDKYEYEIPDSVTSICEWAFCDCSKLSRIIMPDSINEIGEGAFYRCTGLKTIALPESVTRIDDVAFRGCTSLETIYIPDTVTEFGWGLFNGCDKLIVICSPNSAAAEYCEKKNIRCKTDEVVH